MKKYASAYFYVTNDGKEEFTIYKFDKLRVVVFYKLEASDPLVE